VHVRTNFWVVSYESSTGVRSIDFRKGASQPAVPGTMPLPRRTGSAPLAERESGSEISDPLLGQFDAPFQV